MTDTGFRHCDIPSKVAEPVFDNLLAVLQQRCPSRPTLFEFFLNTPLYERLAGGTQPEGMTNPDYVRWLIAAFRNAGYDYATYHGSDMAFPTGAIHAEQTRSLNEGALITDRASFDAYPWPEVNNHDYSAIDAVSNDLPAGMKLVICGPGGVLENVIAIVGFDNLCYLTADDPGLVADLFEAVGSRLVRHYEIAARADAVGACISNDDWGFKTQPMLAPDQMREYVIPWHQRIVETIHAAGKPAILHSCGNQETLWEDIIDTIGYDGKHSYEDTISSVETEYDRFGERIAILGGIDLDFICRSEPDEIHERSRAMIERSAKKGSYALGTGNSVPEYLPDEKYFAMIHAALDER